MKHPLLSLIALQTTHGDILYSTDFDDFAVGDNQWSASPDWATDISNSGVEFIDNLAFNQALGKTAGLGLNRPSRDRVRILKQITHDHLTNGESIIEIETLIAIKDSSNSLRDDFFFSIYNPAGVQLASIRIDNEDPEAQGSNFGFWREDGVSQFDTGFDFLHEELYDLFLTIDLASNTWSASIGGSPLFDNAPFTNKVTGDQIGLGIVAYEWDISANSPSSHGDNFLLVADLLVVSKTPNQPPTLGIEIDQDGTATLSWEGFTGKNYQIQYSETLEENSWANDLPNSTFSTNDISKRFQFTLEPLTNPKRFFRVLQSD